MTLGPVTSQLLTRYSYSRVMMAGGVFCVFSLVVSSFATSVNMLYLTFSVFYGVGTCMCTSPTMTITPEYFDKYMSIATGITVSGSSFGTLIMGPLSQFIIDKAGWRTAFRIYAGFVVITILLNSRIRQPPILSKRKAEGRSFIKDLQIWKNRVFVVWTMAITLVMFGFYIPYVHLVSYAVDEGISQDAASFLVMILGATTAVGRIMFGKIVQHGVLNRLHMHQLSMVVTGTGVMVLPLIKSFTGIVLYVVTVGLVDGCFVVLLPIMTASLIGIEKSVVAWGFLIGTCSVTFTLGPPVAGAIYDATGNYDIAFHCAGIPIVAGAVILFLIPWAQRTSRGSNVLSAITEITFQTSSQDGTGMYPTESMGTICAAEKLMTTENIGSRSHVGVQTMGTSLGTRYSDKSTSTDDVSVQQISLDMADANSQLSYNSRVFDDMLQRSLGSGYSQRTSSDDSNEIPKIPPPSEPIHYRRRADDRERSTSVHSISSHISANADQVGDLGSLPPRLSFKSDICGHLADSQSSLYPSNASVASEHSAFGSSAVSGSIHSDHSAFIHTAVASQSAHSESTNVSVPSASQLFGVSDDPLQPIRPNQEQVHTSHSIISSDVSKQSSNFDQTISDQVNILRDTLKSPTSCSSRMEEALNMTGTVQSRSYRNLTSYEQASISSSEKTAWLNKSSAPVTAYSNPYLHPDPGTSRSEAIQLLQEAIQNDDKRLSENESDDQEQRTGLDKTKFDQDDQLTIIPATNPFGSKRSNQSCSRLAIEDLFKPVTEENNIQTDLSYEVLNTESGERVQQTQSQTGELDMFTHLFKDEET